MRLRSEIENGPWLMLSQQTRHQDAVTYIALNEQMPGITLQAGEALQVAGIRQFIHVDHRLIGLSQPVEHEIAADEAGSAGHKNSHRSDFSENSRSDQANIAQQCLAVDSAAFEMDKARNKAHTPSGSKALKYFPIFGCEPVL